MPCCLVHCHAGGHHTPKPCVRQAFRKYLECGIFAYGFARAWCDDCGHDYFVAYACKGRGVCPSCNTRRMVETGSHLKDHVFPRLPVRQWALSVPKRLCYFMQRDGAVLNMVLRIFLRAIVQSLQVHSPGALSVKVAALHIGAIAFSYRSNSSLNGHVHFHVCVVDGVFEGVPGEEDADGAVQAPAPASSFTRPVLSMSPLWPRCILLKLVRGQRSAKCPVTDKLHCADLGLLAPVLDDANQ